MDLSYATATELLAALAAGELSSRELLEHQLTRIEAVNPALNAVVTLDAERALARAGEADQARARGKSWGPLHGLPMTVKDVFETAGLRTTSGAPELAEHVPERDAVTVARLKAAGAIIVGKTNTPLYAGADQTFNDVFGTTNNPWDVSRSPGGSSGGSAAALAAGMTPLELGSDIGGSIRAPSHFCGTYGLKASWGTVPSRGHIPGPPGSLLEPDVNVCGPMARSVADLVLAHGVLAGPRPEDAVAWHLELPPAEALGPVAVEGLRVALSIDEDGFPLAADVAQVLRSYADRLADAGAVVEEVPLPVPLRQLADSWLDLVVPIIGSGLPDDVFAAFAPLADLEPTDLLGRAGRGMAIRFRDRNAADQRRQQHRARFAEHAQRYDVTLVPPFATAAFPHDERDIVERFVDVDGQQVHDLDAVAWCAGIGTVLVPVVALPAGRTSSGLPVGVQVVGSWLQDRRLLAQAAAMDDVAGGFVAPPMLAT